MCQVHGFLLLTAAFLGLGVLYHYASDQHALMFIAFCVLQLALNYGPNLSTFILPGEVFPAEVRCTFNGVTAAMAKVGALLGSAAFNPINEQFGMLAVMLGCSAISLLGALVTIYFVAPPSDATPDPVPTVRATVPHSPTAAPRDSVPPGAAVKHASPDPPLCAAATATGLAPTASAMVLSPSFATTTTGGGSEAPHPLSPLSPLQHSASHQPLGTSMSPDQDASNRAPTTSSAQPSLTPLAHHKHLRSAHPRDALSLTSTLSPGSQPQPLSPLTPVVAGAPAAGEAGARPKHIL